MESAEIVMENRTKSEIKAKQSLTVDMYGDYIRYIDRGPKTTQTYVKNLKSWATWMAYAGVTQPTREDIKEYRAWLISKHDAIKWDAANGWAYRYDKHGRKVQESLKASTVSAYLRSVKQFFAWTNQEGLYPDIANGIRVPKISKEYKKDALTMEAMHEIEKKIEADGEKKKDAAAISLKDRKGKMQRANEQELRLKAMHMLTLNCGLRTVELSRANVGDYVKHGRQAWLYVYGKGRSEADQKMAIAHEVAKSLDAYIAVRSDGAPKDAPLFVSTGNRSSGKRIASTTISTMLKKAMQSAGYDDPRLTAHSYRHTTATAVMQITGNNISAAQARLRHASPTTTERYLHIDQEKQDAETAEELFSFYRNA